MLGGFPKERSWAILANVNFRRSSSVCLSSLLYCTARRVRHSTTRRINYFVVACTNSEGPVIASLKSEWRWRGLSRCHALYIIHRYLYISKLVACWPMILVANSSTGTGDGVRLLGVQHVVGRRQSTDLRQVRGTYVASGTRCSLQGSGSGRSGNTW